ncbi:MAG: hypothetical protein Q8Q02_02370 [Nocardioides sp.]|nr:hypothetical protein [Nocardioides sp.]
MRDATASGLSGRTGWLVLALSLVVLVAALVVGAMSLRAATDARAADGDRSDAVRVAEQFTAEVNNYDAETVEAYQEKVGDLLTTKFRAEFEQAMSDIVTQVQEAQMTSEGEVLVSGVSSLDPDSAEVLVVADAAVTTVFDQRNRHFRWQISLVKVDDQWRVDDFVPVL